MTIPTSFEQVTSNSPDGAQMGKSASEKNAFYGNTPVVQPSGSSQAALTATLLTTVAATAVTTVAATAVTSITTTAPTTTTTAYGYTTSAQADAIRVRVSQLVVDANVYDTLLNKLIVDVNVFDAKINQAVADNGTTTTLVNKLRTDLVELGILAGS